MMECIKKAANSVIFSNLIVMAQGSSCNFDRQMYLDYAINLMKKTKGKQEMKYKHIIFDLDGTLIDTEEAVLKTWQFTLKEYRYNYSLEELEVVLGITTRKALEKLGVTVNDQFERKWVNNYQKFAKEVSFFAGIKEMLLNLKEQGYSLGIVTSRCKEEYDNYFCTFHLETMFDLIVCADDTKKHKPNPEPLYKYIELAETESSSCIYIGDMPTDIACANNAGIASGLVTWNHSGVLCRDADYIFRLPEELLDRLL